MFRLFYDVPSLLDAHSVLRRVDSGIVGDELLEEMIKLGRHIESLRPNTYTVRHRSVLSVIDRIPELSLSHTNSLLTLELMIAVFVGALCMVILWDCRGR